MHLCEHSGSWTHPLTGQTYPLLQQVTIGELLAGRMPPLPTAIRPYMQATAAERPQPALV